MEQTFSLTSAISRDSTMEDIALAHAIEQGLRSKAVSCDEVFTILEIAQ